MVLGAIVLRQIRQIMLTQSLNLEDTERVHSIQANILWNASQPLERAISLFPQTYTDPKFYDWEVEHIFKKQWLCIGHVSQIPKPGDCLNLNFLNEPIVISRDKHNQVRVMSRVCPHRGLDMMPVDRDQTEKGNRFGFVCPYHHWSYRLDGQLHSAPEMQRSEVCTQEDIKLHTFRSTIWEGFIFMTFDPDLHPLRSLYGGLLPFVERMKMGELELVADVSWDCNFNWKIMVENFLDNYNHLGIHRPNLEPMMPAGATWSEREAEHYLVSHQPFTKHVIDHIKAGNAIDVFPPPSGLPIADKLEYRSCLGFPNFMLSVGPDRVYWYFIQPHSVDRMTLHTMLLVTPQSKADPNYERSLKQEMEVLRRIHTEDMEMCTGLQKGLSSSHYKPGPLSHLETPIWLFQRYLARRIHKSID
jgi:phenylpropionate dioxygenase-like ring-hydroxylating dioxygenase large terminal subunit